jgi:hypothetical protein
MSANYIIFDQHVLKIIINHASIKTLVSMCQVNKFWLKAVQAAYPPGKLKQLHTDLINAEEDGDSLRLAHNQTPEICLAAVQQNGRALKYIKDQTPELRLAAVQQDGMALHCIHFQTSKSRIVPICSSAKWYDGTACVCSNSRITLSSCSAEWMCAHVCS